MLRKRTCNHSGQATTANRESSQPDDNIKQLKARAASKQNRSEPLERCAACVPKSSLQQGKEEKLTSQGKKRRRIGSRIMWKERPLWQECELKMQRQQLNRCRMI